LTKSFPLMITIPSWTLWPSTPINKLMLIFNESDNPTMTTRLA
jgi:hypothetical protein